MERKGRVYNKESFAGIISETEDGFRFTYDKKYLTESTARAISFTLPLREEPYESKTMLPFFDGIIPEGWLLDIAQSNWKIDARDRMGLLLLFCKDCIGAVSVLPEQTEDTHD